MLIRGHPRKPHRDFSLRTAVLIELASLALAIGFASTGEFTCLFAALFFSAAYLLLLAIASHAKRWSPAPYTSLPEFPWTMSVALLVAIAWGIFVVVFNVLMVTFLQPSFIEEFIGMPEGAFWTIRRAEQFTSCFVFVFVLVEYWRMLTVTRVPAEGQTFASAFVLAFVATVHLAIP